MILHWMLAICKQPEISLKFINIEAHMHGTCIPDESNEYPVHACMHAAHSEAILAKLLLKLPHPHVHMHMRACTYICGTYTYGYNNIV